MTIVRLRATVLLLALGGPSAIAADPQPVRPIPFESGTAVSFERLEAIHVGTGPATAVATSGTWLAVGTNRLTAGLPADDDRVVTDIFSGVDSTGRWRSSAGVDLYAIRDDGGLAFAAHAATRNGVRALAVNEKGRLLVADQQYVTCFQMGPKGLVRQWQHFFPRARQVEFGSRGGQPLPLAIVASDQRIDVLADTPGGPVEQRLSFACSCRRFYQGQDTLLVAGIGGEAAVFQIADVADREHLVRTLPLLGSIAGLAPHGPKTAVVVSRDFGLRLLSPTAYMSRAGVPAADLDLAAWQGKSVWRKARDGLVVAERPLADAAEYEAVHAVGPDRALLLRFGGRAETVAIDEAARTLAPPRPVAARGAATPGFVAVAAGPRLAVLLDREGRVWRLDGDTAAPALETVETGPWVSAGERLFVAVGPALRIVTETGLGPAAVTVAGRRIIDAAVDGGTAFVLGEKSLDVMSLDGEPRRIASVPLAAAGRRVFAGAGLACVVQGARDVTTFDVSDPARPRRLATRTLDLPLNWCVPAKFADPERFLFQVDDMLLEADRAIVVGGELFLFDPAELRRGSGPLAPARVVHRPMGSFDDTEQAKRVARVGPDTYHWNSDHIESSRRAYLTRLEPGLGAGAGQPETRHCRAGTALARHVVERDGIAFVAASRMGLRAIRFDGLEAALLGAVTEPDCRFEAVHFSGGVAHVKDGDTIRRYRVAVGPARPGTAFEFTPLAGGTIPKLLDRGQDITTPEYAAGRSLFQRLTVARTDLDDESGWPRTAVPHGTVAVDPVRGRVKFSDGRPAASRFLDEICCYMWPPSGNWWMPVGDYVCAPSGEIGHGFLVFDVRNPDRPSVVGAAGHSPWGAYSNRSIGVRGTTAYIGDNWFRMLIAMDVADPTKPRYVRSIDLPDADLPGIDDPQYRGVFRGDRLLLPTSRGLHEIDVADPAAMRIATVHEKVPALRWLDDAGRRGIEFERHKGLLVLWNLDDPAAPREIARLAAGGAAGLATFQGFLVAGDRLHVWGGIDAGSGGLATWAFSPDAAPRLLGVAPLGGPLTEARVHDGHVLVGRMGPAFEVWRIESPTSARKLGALVGQAFARDYWQHFGGVKPNLLDCRDLVMQGAVRVVHLDGRIAWVKCGDVESACDLGLVAVDWTDPERPRLREGILGPNEETTDVLVDPARRIAQSCGANYLVDLADPERLDVLWGYHNGLAWGAERAAGAAGEIVTRQPRGGFLRLDYDRRDRPHATQTGFTPGLFMADPDARLGGRPAMVAAAKFTRVESDPFPVDPAREVAVAAFVRVLSRANVPAAFRMFLVSTATGKIVAGLEATAAAGGSIQQLARTFKLPPDCREVRVRIEQIDGQVWFAGLQVTQAAANLLPNPDFAAPPREPGRWPGWTVTVSRGSFGQGFHDRASDMLYLPSGPSLLVFDMQNPRPEPVGFTGAEVRPGADEGKAVTVVERGGRKLAVVGTNLGLVTVDVTDPRRPFRLGATSLPWGKMFPMRVGVSGNTAVVAPGYTSFWWTTGLYTVDISDPARPRHVGTIIDNTTGFCIDGTRVYVNSYLNGAAIYDVARPENPLLVEETIFDDTNAGAGGTGLVGDVLVRSMGGGMETWRATLPPQAPTGPLTVAAP